MRNAQREAIKHAHDPWWDQAQPDGMKPVFFGKEYLVGPGEWTSIDVTTPASSGRFKYVVVFEGLDRFRAGRTGKRNGNMSTRTGRTCSRIK